MPRTEEQYEEIREQRQKLIMDTAMKLFAEDGYYSVSISQIAREAAISKGLMYNYFKSKEELLVELVNQGLDEMLDNFDPNHDGVLEHHELINFIENQCRILKKNTRFWKLYFGLVMQPTVFKIVGKRFINLFNEMRSMLCSYFEQAGYDNPEVETHLLFGALEGVSFHYIIDPENYPLKEVKEKLIEKYK